MSNDALWLIKRLKVDGFDNMYFKPFYRVDNLRYWFKADIPVKDVPRKKFCTYIKLCHGSDFSFGDFIFSKAPSGKNDPLEFSIPLDYMTSWIVPISSLRDNDELAKMLFVQCLLYSAHGHDIIIGAHGKTILPANCADNAVVECDMMIDE